MSSASDFKDMADKNNYDDILATIKKLSEAGDYSCHINKYMSQTLIQKLSQVGISVSCCEKNIYELSWIDDSFESKECDS
jgi:hypothetical protein